MKWEYEDIYNLPHHKSDRRPPMPMEDRAAQFAPFAALTGYGDAVEETARLTDSRMELDENALEILDEKLQELEQQLEQRSEQGASAEAEQEVHRKVTVTYFVPDSRKEGGAYLQAEGQVTSVDRYHRVLRMDGGREIPLLQIVEIRD